MPTPGDEKPANGESVGGHMAAELLRNLVIMNENMVAAREIQERLLASVEDLLGYHETYMRGMEILMEKSDEGKNKFSLSDVIHAMAEAADEVLGEPEDEPGEEDPTIPIR